MVTVNIVVYNAAKYLEYAIESVLHQTYKDFEIIAIDDGSTDSTYEILNKYNQLPNFTLIKKEHTKNLGGNRNHAIKLAKGEFITFIDGDDIWEKNKLEVQLSYMQMYDMVCSNASLINEKNEVISDIYFDRFKEGHEISLADLLADNFVVVSSVMIKKSSIEDAGFFEDGPDTRAEDYILWLNYLKNKTIGFINIPLLKYRIHEENWSNSRTEDWIRLLERTLKIRSAYLNHHDSRVRISASKGCADSYLRLAKATYKEKNYYDAKKYIKNLLSFYSPKFSYKYLKYILGYIYMSLFCIIKKIC